MRAVMAWMAVFIWLTGTMDCANAQGLSREKIEELGREVVRNMVKSGITIKDINVAVRGDSHILEMMVFNSTGLTATGMIVECELVESSSGRRVPFQRAIHGPLPSGFGVRFPVHFGQSWPIGYYWTACRVLDAELWSSR